jgi:hypothetical protein
MLIMLKSVGAFPEKRRGEGGSLGSDLSCD